MVKSPPVQSPGSIVIKGGAANPVHISLDPSEILVSCPFSSGQLKVMDSIVIGAELWFLMVKRVSNEVVDIERNTIFEHGLAGRGFFVGLSVFVAAGNEVAVGTGVFVGAAVFVAGGVGVF